MPNQATRAPLVLITALTAGISFGLAPREPSQASFESKVQEVVQPMSAFMAALEQFSLEISETYQLVEEGEELKVSNLRSLTVRRPDRLFGRVRGDLAKRSVWYNGKSLTLLDEEYNVYTTEKAPDNLVALLTHLDEQFDIAAPLAHLLFSDIPRHLDEQVRAATYVGRETVADVECHHLAFVQDDLDWELWVETGERPLPRRLVVVYKQEPDQPRYRAEISSWNLAAQATDSVFEFKPPSGARKMELTVPGAEQKPPN